MACTYGNLKILQWSHSTFNLSDEDIREPRLFSLCCFSLAARNTHFSVLTWLNLTFNVPRKDALNAFYWIVVGHRYTHFFYGKEKTSLDLVKWLHSVFNFTEKEIYGYDEALQILQKAKNNNLEVYQWVKSTFK
jgi:sugar (pentulose or hexulose) kinase